MHADHRRALRCARHYIDIGLTPLPSYPDEKRPMLPSFAEHYGPIPVPESVYRDWRTPNIQILTGVRTPGPTKIIVVDLDGREALDAWTEIAREHAHVPKEGWMSITGSGGRHLWFTLPPGIAACPSGILWGLWDTGKKKGRGGWVKHKEIRLLGDNALVVAPPSIHVDTGKRYQFLEPGPNACRLPEPAPDWLLAMPRLQAPRLTPAPKSEHVLKSPTRPSGASYGWKEVLDAIPDKVALAGSWGLRIASSRHNANGWVPCHAIDREDRHPSASFSAETGRYHDCKDGLQCSLFDLGVLLGRFGSPVECRDACGDQFLGRRPASGFERWANRHRIKETA